MAESILQAKDALIKEIRDRIIYLLHDDIRRNVFLEDVYFYHSDILENRNRITITCIFFNDEGNLCIDMYRSGYDMYSNYMCGIRLDSLDERVLNTIVKAFDEDKFFVEAHSYDLCKEKTKRLNLFSAFKSVFSQKSA